MASLVPPPYMVLLVAVGFVFSLQASTPLAANFCQAYSQASSCAADWRCTWCGATSQSILWGSFSADTGPGGATTPTLSHATSIIESNDVRSMVYFPGEWVRGPGRVMIISSNTLTLKGSDDGSGYASISLSFLLDKENAWIKIWDEWRLVVSVSADVATLQSAFPAYFPTDQWLPYEFKVPSVMSNLISGTQTMGTITVRHSITVENRRVVVQRLGKFLLLTTSIAGLLTIAFDASPVGLVFPGDKLYVSLVGGSSFEYRTITAISNDAASVTLDEAFDSNAVIPGVYVGGCLHDALSYPRTAARAISLPTVSSVSSPQGLSSTGFDFGVWAEVGDVISNSASSTSLTGEVTSIDGETVNYSTLFPDTKVSMSDVVLFDKHPVCRTSGSCYKKEHVGEKHMVHYDHPTLTALPGDDLSVYPLHTFVWLYNKEIGSTDHTYLTVAGSAPELFSTLGVEGLVELMFLAPADGEATGLASSKIIDITNGVKSDIQFGMAILIPGETNVNYITSFQSETDETTFSLALQNDVVQSLSNSKFALLACPFLSSDERIVPTPAFDAVKINIQDGFVDVGSAIPQGSQAAYTMTPSGPHMRVQLSVSSVTDNFALKIGSDLSSLVELDTSSIATYTWQPDSLSCGVAYQHVGCFSTGFDLISSTVDSIYECYELAVKAGFSAFRVDVAANDCWGKVDGANTYMVDCAPEQDCSVGDPVYVINQRNVAETDVGLVCDPLYFVIEDQNSSEDALGSISVDITAHEEPVFEDFSCSLAYEADQAANCNAYRMVLSSDESNAASFANVAPFGQVLLLTDAVYGQVGASWYRRPLHFQHGFDLSVKFAISEPLVAAGDACSEGGCNGGAGLAIVIQSHTEGPNTIGCSSSGLGYGSYEDCDNEIPGIAIELDTHGSLEKSDPLLQSISYNAVSTEYSYDTRHIAVMASNTLKADHSSEAMCSVSNIPAFNDGELHHLHIRYMPRAPPYLESGYLTIWLDDMRTPVLHKCPITLAPLFEVSSESPEYVRNILDPAGNAFLGFTASTEADRAQKHVVKGWDFCASVGCAPLNPSI